MQFSSAFLINLSFALITNGYDCEVGMTQNFNLW